MIPSLEKLKFEAKERALEEEIKRNPQHCPSCSYWQYGGDMSSALFHCPFCNTKQAKSDIKKLIQNKANQDGITYEEAWDLANDFLNQKNIEYGKKGTIYFDEDHFFCDLHKHFKF